MDAQIKEKIESILNKSPIVLFMKGTPDAPACGFSARAVSILKEVEAQFEGVNVLENADIRSGIKEYGNWPTIPQLYVNKELIGGSDILLEMYQSGELQDLLKPKAE